MIRKVLLIATLIVLPAPAWAWGLTACIDEAIDDCSNSWVKLQQHAHDADDDWLFFKREVCVRAAVQVCMEKGLKLHKYGKTSKEPANLHNPRND